MNDVPPPLDQEPIPFDQITPQDSGSGKKVAVGCGIGCLVALVVSVVVVLGVINFGKKKLGEMAARSTSAEPVAIDPPVVSEAQIDDAVTRFDDFYDAMSAGASTEPLVLSADDINTLLFHHPSFQKAAGYAIVSIEDDQLSGKVSLNLDEIEIPFKFIETAVEGRYFNGDVTLSAVTEAGRPAIYIEDIAIDGIPISPEFMAGFRKENLLKNSQSDPQMKKFFEKVKELKIENNRLVIVPATSP